VLVCGGGGLKGPSAYYRKKFNVRDMSAEGKTGFSNGSAKELGPFESEKKIRSRGKYMEGANEILIGEKRKLLKQS